MARQEMLVPLARIAALLAWPDAEPTEGQYLAELVERTDCLLLVDVANLHANAVDVGTDPARFVDEIPLAHLAYVHVASGTSHDGFYVAGGWSGPVGLDPSRIRVEIHAKRLAVAMRLRPDLVDELGERFIPLFDEWATGRPRRTGTSFDADMDAFSAWLETRAEPA